MKDQHHFFSDPRPSNVLMRLRFVPCKLLILGGSKHDVQLGNMSVNCK